MRTGRKVVGNDAKARVGDRLRDRFCSRIVEIIWQCGESRSFEYAEAIAQVTELGEERVRELQASQMAATQTSDNETSSDATLDDEAK
ncbi:MAG: hypothetical protein HC925_03030 [Coleofasciculaceae cyanobacterium SM2_3_26]|nr:hypothetical protein [Coleofasciculaceae cyanobacterium SM2_3_26]